MAHIDSRTMYQFRVPTTEINRAFRKTGAALLITMVMVHLLMPNGISSGTIIMVCAIGIAGYFSAKHHVWVSLSADGVSGRGYTNRKVTIFWHDPVVVNTARISDMDGFQIRASENGGFVKKQTLSLFIPRAITDTPEFSESVAKFAPADHPLRALSNNAP